jgi:hypothetical protein
MMQSVNTDQPSTPEEERKSAASFPAHEDQQGPGQGRGVDQTFMDAEARWNYDSLTGLRLLDMGGDDHRYLVSAIEPGVIHMS